MTRGTHFHAWFKFLENRIMDENENFALLQYLMCQSWGIDNLTVDGIASPLYILHKERITILPLLDKYFLKLEGQTCSWRFFKF